MTDRGEQREDGNDPEDHREEHREPRDVRRRILRFGVEGSSYLTKYQQAVGERRQQDADHVLLESVTQERSQHTRRVHAARHLDRDQGQREHHGCCADRAGADRPEDRARALDGRVEERRQLIAVDRADVDPGDELCQPDREADPDHRNEEQVRAELLGVRPDEQQPASSALPRLLHRTTRPHGRRAYGR